MTKFVTITGGAARTSRQFDDTLEFVVHDVVVNALKAASTSLDAVDMVVTVASDTMDGVMVATRSEIAGTCGRGFLNVPSSSGHALAAAVALIESGQAETVLLVGWGEGSKLREHDYREILANPFYERPVGGDPAAMAGLQAQRLKADGHLIEGDMEQYLREMTKRAGHQADSKSGPLAWLSPQWCDGAAALVLRAEESESDSKKGGVYVSDVGVAFRSYVPAGDDMDPALWIQDAFEHRRDEKLRPQHDPVLVEASATTPFCEARAVKGFLAKQKWIVEEACINSSGGGAAAYFGPATGLHGLVVASKFFLEGKRSADPAFGVFVDLAGPIGQAATVAILEARGARA